MAILWAGSEPEAFGDATPPGVYTTSSDLDTDYARAGIALGGPFRCNKEDLGDLTEVWWHYRWGGTSTGGETNNRELVVFHQGDGQGILRFYQSGTAPNKTLQYWNGSTWTAINTPVEIVTANNRTIDICCKIDAIDGRFALFVDGELVAELTGDTDFFSSSGVDYVTINNWGNTNARRCNECIIANESTLGMRLATITPSANGSNTAWTGVFSDINGSTTNDSTMISSGTADQYETNAMTDLSTPAAALQPVAVVSSIRARNAPSGPQNIQHVVRTGGQEFESGNAPGLTTTFQNGFQAIWGVNPVTTDPWTPSDINGLEIGVRSVT